jgi:peptidoglycan-N-acetylglucosamine deacetylase
VSPAATTPGTGLPTPTATPSGDPGASPTPKPPKPLPAYITHGKRNGTDKVIALTFDADMYPFMYATKDSYHEYDTRVLKLIKDNDLHATIFANGLYLKAYPDIIASLAKQPGIEIGSHTWDHADWTDCSDPAAPALTNKKTEITKVTDIVKEVTGNGIDWFRFPGGCYGGTADLNLVKSYGQWPVGWDCYFGDSLGWNGDQEFANVKNTCKNGSIVITHLDNTKYHPGIYDALKQLIPWWKKNGWTVVNITELMGQSPPKP